MRAYLAVLFLALPVPLAAQDHAAHHAKAADRLGTVHFSTSCKPAVAPQFDRSVALLHSFEFGAAIKGFSQVLEADSTCAMAHWGIALGRWSNPIAPGVRGPALLRQGQASVTAAMRLQGNATARERGYIQAVSQLYQDFENRDQRARVQAYEKAMRDLAATHRDDPEAAIFHAIALTASASPTDKTYANQLEAGRILEPLWVRMPDHPGIAHYIIHSYDYPPLAGRAREAARRYAEIAPSAAHALHMPSHTFTRVGMWEQSIETNMRSWRVALAAGSLAEALHAADYAMYAHLQLGNEREAKAILDSVPVLATRFDPAAVGSGAPGSAGLFALAAIPARWALERRAWREAGALVPRTTAFPYTEAMTWFARGLAASRLGDLDGARVAIDSLTAFETRLKSAGEAYWAEQVAIQRLAASAWLHFAEGRKTEALSLMNEAARREDATEKSAVTPGPLAPARELLGDMLLELKRPEEARAAYTATLEREPGRRHSRRLAAR